MIMLFIVFKGVDGHGGTAPATVVDYVADLEVGVDEGVPESERVNREGFVFYPQFNHNNRQAGLALTPSVALGNRLPARKADMNLRNFAEHGRHFLGNQNDCMNRMAIEICKATYNQALLCGL